MYFDWKNALKIIYVSMIWREDDIQEKSFFAFIHFKNTFKN